MRRVFADTGFFRVLADVRDDRYEAAKTFRRVRLEEGCRFVLTDYVFTEAILRVRYDLDWRKAREIGDEILNKDEFEVVAGWDYLRGSWDEFFLKYRDKRFSFTDCVSFKVMKELGISEVITVDQDFDRVNQGFLPIYL